MNNDTRKTQVLATDKTGAKVIFPNCTAWLWVNLHEDEDGNKYVYDHQLRPLLLRDCEWVGEDVVEDADVETAEEVDPIDPMDDESFVKTFIFEVEYEHKGRLDGWARTESKVRARNYEQAVERLKAKFKNIFEMSYLDWQY